MLIACENLLFRLHNVFSLDFSVLLIFPDGLFDALSLFGEHCSHDTALVGHNEVVVGKDTSVVVKRSVVEGSDPWEIVVVLVLDDFSVAMSHVAVREVMFSSKTKITLPTEKMPYTVVLIILEHTTSYLFSQFPPKLQVCEYYK